MVRVRRGRAALVALTVAVAVAGCSGSGNTEGPAAAPAGGPEAPAWPGVKLVVAAVGEAPILASVAAQRGEWEASRGAAVAVRDTPATPADTAGAHVLVFRGDRLGDLVDAGALAVL